MRRRGIEETAAAVLTSAVVLAVAWGSIKGLVHMSCIDTTPRLALHIYIYSVCSQRHIDQHKRVMTQEQLPSITQPLHYCGPAFVTQQLRGCICHAAAASQCQGHLGLPAAALLRGRLGCEFLGHLRGQDGCGHHHHGRCRPPGWESVHRALHLGVAPEEGKQQPLSQSKEGTDQERRRRWGQGIPGSLMKCKRLLCHQAGDECQGPEDEHQHHDRDQAACKHTSGTERLGCLLWI